MIRPDIEIPFNGFVQPRALFQLFENRLPGNCASISADFLIFNHIALHSPPFLAIIKGTNWPYQNA